MVKIIVSEEEYQMILEALRYTRYLKFLKKKGIKDYRNLGIKLGDTNE